MNEIRGANAFQEEDINLLKELVVLAWGMQCVGLLLIVQQNRIKDIMVLCDVEDVDLSWGMLFLVTYVFLLRLPSEAGLTVL